MRNETEDSEDCDMLKRILTAVIAIPFAILIMFLYDTIIYNIAIAAVNMIMISEMLSVNKCLKYRLPAFICFIYGTGLPILMTQELQKYRLPFIFVCVLLMCISLIIYHSKLNFMKFFYMAASAVLLTAGSTCLISILRFSPRHGAVYAVLTLTLAWIADSGAYFVGTFLGKHKLCPDISPKKTVEGLIGGLLTNGLIAIVFSLAYVYIMKMRDIEVEADYLLSFILGVVCAGLGTVGDLTASIIKRQCQVKDFGKIFPGHGGMLDRFDSVLFVAPFLYITLQFAPLYTFI